MKKFTRQIGSKAEAVVEALLSKNNIPYEKVRASGQVSHRGDLLTEDLAIEVKTGTSISISSTRWQKIMDQAAMTGKIPVMVSVLPESDKVLVTIDFDYFMTLYHDDC